MRDRLDTLTDREKETLRLLLAGHDAKSIARAQALSVHTVNERLRDARRKLGVASSREAARLLAEAGTPPDSLGDKKFGVAEAAVAGRNGGEPDRRPTAGHRLAWLGGGMLIMSIVIAAAALALLSTGEEAKRLNHQHIGPEHLLLGLLLRHDCVAAEILRGLGLSVEKVREDLAKQSGGTSA